MFLLNLIFSVVILCCFSVLGTILPYRDGNSLWWLLSILWLFTEPMKFLVRRKYKKVSSSWYQKLSFFIFLIILFFICFRIELSLLVIYGMLFLLLFLNIFTKKELFIRSYDVSKILLFIIFICTGACYFCQIELGFLGIPLALSISIFSFILLLLIQNRGVLELRVIYILLMIICLLSKQFLPFILFICLFLDLDH